MTGPIKVQDSAIVFNGFFKVRQDQLINSNQKTYDYYTLETKTDAVVILPITHEGLFVLNEEYRHPAKKVLLSCPGGYLNENEPPEKAAVRELKEETGYLAKELFIIGSAYPYPGISNQKLTFVLGKDAEKIADPALEIGEMIATKLFSYEEILKLIAKESQLEECHLDGVLCTALFFYSQFINFVH